MVRCAIWYHLFNFKNVKNTCGALIKIDPCEKNNQKQISDVDVGFTINQEIRSFKQVNKNVNDGMIFQFKK